mgnify:CR=1 FL=1
MKPPSRPPVAVRQRQQRGMVLVTGLLLLVLVTLVVLAASRSGRLQTIMASNTRERDIAFQAAEAALLDGEVQIATKFHAIFTAPANSAEETPANGLLNRVTLDDEKRYGLIARGSTMDYWVNDYGWFKADGSVDTGKSIAISHAIAGVDEAPRFVVEYLGIAGGITCGSLSHYRYRITALATGASTGWRKQADTRVVLQTEYRHCAA